MLYGSKREIFRKKTHRTVRQQAENILYITKFECYSEAAMFQCIGKSSKGALKI